MVKMVKSLYQGIIVDFTLRRMLRSEEEGCKAGVSLVLQKSDGLLAAWVDSTRGRGIRPMY